MRNLSPNESVDVRIARLASTRYGVFTHAEALALGATKSLIARRLAAKRWERLFQAVYCLFGSASTWQRHLLAVCLLHGEPAVASHLAAAGLWGFAGISPGALEISAPPRRRRECGDVVVHEVSDLFPADLTVVDGIPVTSVARTLIDLAGVVPPEVGAVALDDALRRRIASVKWVRSRVAELRRSGKPGIAVIEKLLDVREGGPPPESPFETGLFRLILDSGLPRPLRQHIIMDGKEFVARVDFAYPLLRLAIEADGYGTRFIRSDWEADRARQNRLQALDWRVLRITWRMYKEEPDEVIALIWSAKRERGIHSAMDSA